MNGFGVGWTAFAFGIGGDYPFVGKPVITPCKESAVVVPSDMIAFGDTTMTTRFESIEGYFWYPAYNLKALAGPISDEARRAEAIRHLGKFNTAFCDGHIESLKPASLFTRSKAVMVRWNRDHEVHADLVPP